MKMKENDKKVRKRLYAAAILSFAVLYSLCCFLLSPLYFGLDSNIAFSNTVLPVIVQYVGIAAELIAISVFYGIMIYGIYRFGHQGFRASIGIYAIATVGKYTANIVMTWMTYNRAIPRNWLSDIGNIVFYTALEMVQLIIIYAISRHIIANNRAEALPFGKLYDRGNPLMKSAFVCGVVTVAAKLLGKLADDALAIILSGLPKNPMTVVLMILSYLSVAVLGVICYFVTVSAVSRAYELADGNRTEQ